METIGRLFGNVQARCHQSSTVFPLRPMYFSSRAKASKCLGLPRDFRGFWVFLGILEVLGVLGV